jgi:hypothetical protein
MSRGCLAVAPWALIAAAAALSAGCKKEDPARSGAAAGTVRAQAAADASAPLALTPARLEAFVKYQARLVALYDAVLKQRERQGGEPGALARLPDGGWVDPVKASLALFEGKAGAEEQARAEAGLSEEEVAQLEPLVAEVISERANARDQDPSESIRKFEAMRDQLSEDQRAPVEEQIAEMRLHHEELMGNAEQRQRYGDAAVDLVLTREAELIRLRKEWIARIAAMTR